MMSRSWESYSTNVINQWLAELQEKEAINLVSDPNYYASRPEILIGSSLPVNLLLGDGKQALSDVFLAIQSAKHEILFVTCFWAKSHSQVALASALRTLSARALAQSRRIRVRICFSSLSPIQMLTQSSSLLGKEYPLPSWIMLGLPDPTELGGLDLTVKSVFVWPFSVMHSKFVIVDRQTVFLPSCNISWESWFEGCIELRGDIVVKLSLFWQEFWGRDENLPLNLDTGELVEDPSRAVDLEARVAIDGPVQDLLRIPLSSNSPVMTILLPSPHQRNPAFRPVSASIPPPSPLNLFLLNIFSAAKESIYIQTPNVTSPPVLSAILSALGRGVNVKIVTNTKMMMAEQIITSGQLTECALLGLRRRYQQAQLSRARSDIEEGQAGLGKLEMFYYDSSLNEEDKNDGPVKSHLKLTIVDQEIVVLGSGNMDRASWYTSQELGVAFIGRELAVRIAQGVSECLKGRLRSAAPGSLTN
jgi:phosphatidylserine/phosphatidylglycerophosphate/cardiolipin synthase-like enzyme